MPPALTANRRQAIGGSIGSKPCDSLLEVTFRTLSTTATPDSGTYQLYIEFKAPALF